MFHLKSKKTKNDKKLLTSQYNGMNMRMGMVDEYQHLNAANFSTKTLDLMYHEEFSRVYISITIYQIYRTEHE